jgi:uncharacterized protein (TIGR02246 family)
MMNGDLERLLSVYDADVTFVNQAGETRKGKEQLKQELAPFAAAKAHFDFRVRQVIQADGIALMHTEWKVSSPREMSVYAIEVARQQSDGSWLWLIGDPFTVGKNLPNEISESVGG